MRRVLPGAGALLVIVLLGGVALRIGSSNLDDAERTRLASRVVAVDGLAENAEDVNDANAEARGTGVLRADRLAQRRTRWSRDRGSPRDRRGIAFNAWSTGRIGEEVVTPAEVEALPTGEVVAWTADRDGREHTYVGTRLDGGYALVFEQATDLLYGDLRGAEAQRSGALIVLLVIGVGGIAGIQLLRERTARREEARVEAFLRNSQDIVLVTTADGRLRFVSPAIEGVLGHLPRRWRGRTLAELAAPSHRDAVNALVAGPDRGTLHDVQLVAADGTRRWFDLDARDLTDHPEVGGILLTCHEVGARKALQDELLHQSTHDRLTGLPDRQLLSARLEALLALGPDVPFALLYIDLDRFKPVNDTLGHDAGDAVLQTVARRLADVADPDAWPARLGGDEFVVVSEDCDEASAVVLAERLRDTSGPRSPWGRASSTSTRASVSSSSTRALRPSRPTS